MAEPKDPSSTKPYTPPARETTRPIRPVTGRTPAVTPRISETTRPTEKITDMTRPTAQMPRDSFRETTRPVKSITGKTEAIPSPPPRRTGTVPRIQTGSVPKLTSTGSVPRMRSTGTVPRVGTGSVPRLGTGSVPRLRQTGSVSRLSGKTNPGAVRADLMTEGMRARRREIERKKRRAAIERMQMEAELTEGWRRVWKTVGLILLAAALGYGYFRVQGMYGNQWPLMAVWCAVSIAMITGFAWILWYMNRSDI
jgi:hypothetical protein